MGNAVNHTAHSPSHLQTGEDLPVSAQGAQAPATLCASQTADVMALGITPRWLNGPHSVRGPSHVMKILGGT